MKPRTMVAEALGRVAEPFRDIIPPVHPATTYERAPDGGYPGGRKYSRDENPTYDAPEALLAALEGGEQALLFGSGLAAAVAVFQSLRPGDAVLVPRRMYWALRKWLLGPATDWGLRVVLYENGDIDQLSSLAARHRPALVWVETPANPTWDIQDLRATAEVAHRHGAIVAADSTVATPVLTRPLELGADLVMHSATKYLNGHSDVVAGALVTRQNIGLWQRVRETRVLGGAVPGPFEAWLLLRGMRTLVLRVEAACANALAVSEAIEGHPAVSQVLYPGLPSHPGHEVARKQMRGGYGAMLSVRLAGGEPAARAFIAGLKLFKQATSLGSVESLVEHRASVEGEGTLCPSDLVRLSIGIEDASDLIADIARSLSALK